jgi:4-hydroxybenzoate polyprenyltransferase
MRSAGCVINDFLDRDFDGKVERTKSRPLVTGEVSPNEALVLFTILITLSSFLLIWMNIFTFYIALIGLALASLYPLTKRFLSVPQFFLGLAFSWGIMMVSAAETNQISGITLILFFSCWSWIVAYDTAYALCDKKDDLALGINSSAIAFGKNTVVIFILFHLVSLLLLMLVAVFSNFHPSFYFFILVSALLIVYQAFLIKSFDSDKCLKAFKNNNWLGMSICIGSILGVSL